MLLDLHVKACPNNGVYISAAYRIDYLLKTQTFFISVSEAYAEELSEIYEQYLSIHRIAAETARR